MAILSFLPLPEDFLGQSITRNPEKLFRIDGPLIAGDTLIEAVTTYRYSSGTPDYDVEYQPVDVEISGEFAYGNLGTVSGTVTQITLRIDDTAFLTLTGLDIDAGRAWVAMMGSAKPFATLLAGDDRLTGTDDQDNLSGYAGDDLIAGHGGNDDLSGNGGRDTIYGGAGRDWIQGGAGADELHGGEGNDSIRGGSQNDVIYGDAGGDWLNGGSGDDEIHGGDGRDWLYGQAGDDTLFGGEGNDRIEGDAGDDILSGEAGNDRLTGGQGNDSLSGGEGVDKFIFSEFGKAGKSGSDIVTDFEAGETIGLGQVEDATAVVVTQVGADVTIAMADAEIDSLITLLGATAAEVEAAIVTTSWYYY